MKHVCEPFAAALLLLAVSAGRALPAESASTGFPLRPLPYYVDQAALPIQALPGATTSWGMTARGSGYRIEFPDTWNGDLLVLLRGGGSICDADTKTGCRINDPLTPLNRARLIAEGYAWAAPTYRDNRVAIETHAQDVLDVVDVFRKAHPNPPRGKGRAFLMGFSMGGNTTMAAIELFPKVFAGAIAGCSGDTRFQSTYYFNLHLAAAALAAPSSPDIAAYLKQFGMPPNLAASKRLGPQFFAALGPDFPHRTNEAGDRYREIVKRLSGGERPLFEAAFEKSIGPMVTDYIALADAVDSGPRSLIDNRGTDYGADLNPLIPRFSCDPAACPARPVTQGQSTDLGGNRLLSGKISVPVMTIETTGELTVPLSAGQDYADRVERAGRSKLLIQRAYREIDHCGFNADEVGEAFDDLVKWVDTGVRPQGDDIRDGKAVAAPDFGCKFTRGGHKNDPDYAKACHS
jgi:pimeloyl-ACP methyl ester carboxylesterase